MRELRTSYFEHWYYSSWKVDASYILQSSFYR